MKRVVFALLLITFSVWAGEFVGDNKVALKKPYKFSEDVFSHRSQDWPELLSPIAGKPSLNYLEIGVYEGRSFLWVLENILTHESSRATAVDIFPDNLLETFTGNLKMSGYKDKVKILKGKSEEMLRQLEMNSFDLIYIDGSHRARDVYIDAALSWGLLKPEGYLIFDDYLWHKDLAPELSPNLPINAFLNSFYGDYELLSIGRQVRIKKLASSECSEETRCSSFGTFYYSWRNKTLKSRRGKEIKLDKNEINLIEKILNVRFFDTKYIKEEYDQIPAWISLSKKLNVSIVDGSMIFKEKK